MDQLKPWALAACAVALSISLASCSDSARHEFVYVMTNRASGNQVIAFMTVDSGDLIPHSVYFTGGLGTGTAEVSPATPQDGVDPLASQGSVALSSNRQFLFVVNAGSDDVTSFRADAGILTFADIEPSGGEQPNCLASFRNLLYVANVGDASNGYSSNITGFRIGHEGDLTRLPGPSVPLSASNAQPACIAFSPTGDLLAVSELTTDRITVFSVSSDGTLSSPVPNLSNGEGPFGAVFLSNGTLVVTEAQPAVTGSISSYDVANDGTISVISGSVAGGQFAPCWIAVTPDGHFAYTANSAPGTVTSFEIVPGNQVFLLQRVASSLEGPSSGCIDLDVSRNGRTLYVLDGGIGAISVLRIEDDGTLTPRQLVTHPDLPTLGSQGLVVR